MKKLAYFLILFFMYSQLYAESGSETIMQNIYTKRLKEVYIFLEKRSFDGSFKCENAEILALTSIITEQCLDGDLDKCDQLCSMKIPETLEWDFILLGYYNQIGSANFYSICEFHGGLQLFSKKLYEDKTCERGKPFKDLIELNHVFASVDKKEPFEVSEPSFNCYERAVLLASHLNDMGISTNLIQYISSPALGDMILPYKGKNHEFINHWVVEVRLESGERYILDPQFQDEPVLLSQFPQKLTPENVEILEYGLFKGGNKKIQNGKTISYERYHPFTNIYELNRQLEASHMYNSSIVPTCSEAKKLLKKEAVEILETRPSFTPN